MDRLAAGNTLSWLCLGDFNEILNSGEKSGGNLRRDDHMNEFRDFLN